eukprot:2764203-Pleurochrysis_carterae.AAC.1
MSLSLTDGTDRRSGRAQPKEHEQDAVHLDHSRRGWSAFCISCTWSAGHVRLTDTTLLWLAV